MIKIMSITDKYMCSSLDLVEEVFTEYSNKEEGILVRHLIEEIRNMDKAIARLRKEPGIFCFWGCALIGKFFEKAIDKSVYK